MVAKGVSGVKNVETTVKRYYLVQIIPVIFENSFLMLFSAFTRMQNNHASVVLNWDLIVGQRSRRPKWTWRKHIKFFFSKGLKDKGFCLSRTRWRLYRRTNESRQWITFSFKNSSHLNAMKIPFYPTATILQVDSANSCSRKYSKRSPFLHHLFDLLY